MENKGDFDMAIKYYPNENGFQYYFVDCDERVSPYLDDSYSVRDMVMCFNNREASERCASCFNTGVWNVHLYGSDDPCGVNLKVHSENPLVNRVNCVEELPKSFVKCDMLKIQWAGLNGFILFKLDFASNKVVAAMEFDMVLPAIYCSIIMSRMDDRYQYVLVETRQYAVGFDYQKRMTMSRIPDYTLLFNKDYLDKMWEYNGNTERFLTNGDTKVDWEFFERTTSGKHSLYYQPKGLDIGYFLDKSMLLCFRNILLMEKQKWEDERLYQVKFSKTTPTEIKKG